jgi:urease accessory protein
VIPSRPDRQPYATVPVLPLLVWLSPAFPVGGFAYSHALEWAAEAGDLPHAHALEAWIVTLLQRGSLRNDAILLAASWHASVVGEGQALSDANDLALALVGSRERYLETTAQGNAFVTAIRAAWSTPDLAAHVAHLQSGSPGTGDIAYPVAVGLAAACHGIELGATLDAYLIAVVTNLTSAAIRLSVIGQTSAQAIIVASLPAMRALAACAANATLDDVGGCAFRSDIAAMKHETQYTRLFRS